MLAEDVAVTDDRTLARAVLMRLAALASERPAVLVLEDLHWADVASVDLLTRISDAMASLPLLIIATWRDAEGASRDFSTALMNVARFPHCVRIALQRLDVAETNRWISQRFALDEDDQRRLYDFISRSAEGNPLFITEIVRELELSRTLHFEDGRWLLEDLETIVVPPILQQLIASRLNELEPSTRRILETCAILGQTFPSALLSAVDESDEAEIAAAIAAAREAQILRSTRRNADLEFEHALTREVLYQHVSEHVRQDIHRRAAEVLLATTHPDADRVGAHLLEARDDRAAEWLLQAGDRAERMHAWSDAIQRFESALEILAWSPEDQRLRGWLHYRVACLSRYRDSFVARERCDDGLDIGYAIGDVVLVAYSRYLRGLIEVFAEHTRRGLDELLAAIDLLEHLPVLDRLRLNATQGIFNPDALPLPTSGFVPPLNFSVPDGSMLGDLDRRATVATLMAEAGRLDEALDLSVDTSYDGEGSANPSQSGRTGHALQTSAYVHALAGRPVDSAADFDRAERAFRDAGRTLMVADCLASRLIVLTFPYHADGRAERSAEIAEVLRLGARLGEFEALESSSDHWLVYAHFLEGRWDFVSRLVGTPQRPTFAGRYRQHIYWVAGMLMRERGYPGIAWEWLERSLPDSWLSEPGNTEFLAGVQSMVLAAELALDAGDTALAERWLATHRRWMDWSGAVLSNAEANIARGRMARMAGDDDAARAYAFEALAQAVEPRQPLAQIAAQRLLCELSMDAGGFEGAAEYLGRALSIAEMSNVPHELLACRVAHANLLNARGDQRAAQDVAARARANAEELSARRLFALLDQLEFVHSSDDDALTAREIDVLRSVAKGLTDAETASELFIATRTVNAHMRSIRSKLGVDTRMRAVQVARERGML